MHPLHPSNDGPGLKIEYKHSLKSYIEGQFFEISQPVFEPATLKLLMKITSAGRGHFELLVSPPGETSSSEVIY